MLPTRPNCASNGTSRRSTGQLARYAAIIASCATRPDNRPFGASASRLGETHLPFSVRTSHGTATACLKLWLGTSTLA